MRLEVYRTLRLRGSVSAPGSKSYTHREIIAAMLSGGKSTIRNYLDCDDTRATIDACRALGATIEEGDPLVVYGAENLKAGRINCRESGTTLRLITPLAALAEGVTEIDGEGRLKGERPIEAELEAMRQLGIECYSTNGHLPLRIVGPVRKGGRCNISGDQTSQFVSGLLFYLPLAETLSEIRVTTELKSKPYVETTLEVLRNRGIDVSASEYLRSFRIPPNQKLFPRNSIIPGDYSSTANVLVASAVTASPITVKNLYQDTQGDRKILEILERSGAGIRVGKDFVETLGGELYGFEFDAADNPDLVPALAVLALRSNGNSVIRGVKRLAYKESDRLAAIMDLRRMGGKLELIDNDTLRIRKSELRDAEMDPRGDHRNVMVYAVAGLVAGGKTLITNADTNKSYPKFVEDMKKLGAKIRTVPDK